MIKELNKFGKELKAYRTGNILPQADVKNALIDIYEANFKKKWGVQTINRGCPTCISDMMRCLSWEWHNQQVEFKGVPQELTPEKVMDTVGEMLSSTPTYQPKEASKEAQIAHLQQQCKERGIKYHHKAGIKKLTELLEC